MWGGYWRDSRGRGECPDLVRVRLCARPLARRPSSGRPGGPASLSPPPRHDPATQAPAGRHRLRGPLAGAPFQTPLARILTCHCVGPTTSRPPRIQELKPLRRATIYEVTILEPDPSGETACRADGNQTDDRTKPSGTPTRNGGAREYTRHPIEQIEQVPPMIVALGFFRIQASAHKWPTGLRPPSGVFPRRSQAHLAWGLPLSRRPLPNGGADEWSVDYRARVPRIAAETAEATARELVMRRGGLGGSVRAVGDAARADRSARAAATRRPAVGFRR